MEALIEMTLDQIYKKTSRDISADRMIVSEKREVPSNAGLCFYISTAHIKSNVTMLMAGIHIIPFDKPYAVNFTMVSPVDPKATEDNDTMTRVFNSFHILGERPIK